MQKQTDPAVFQMAMVRKEILSYCEPLPQIIKAHGPASVGCVALAIGKCFNWIGPTVDRYLLNQPLPGVPCPTVSHLGEELRLIGLDMMHGLPGIGELDRTIATLQSQLELLQRISASERGAK